METRIRLVVRCAGGRQVEGRVHGAIGGEGCTVEGRDRTRTAGGAIDQGFIVKLPTIEHLHRVVRSVEAIQGAAVVEVKEFDRLETSMRE